MTEQLIEPAAEYEPADAFAEPGAEPQAAPEPTGPIRVAWASVPRVNLLPIEVVEARRFRRIQLMLAATLVGAVALAGSGTYQSQRAVTAANDSLRLAQASVQRYQAQQARYAAVPQLIASLGAARTALSSSMSTDVLWAQYLNNLAGALPSGVQLVSDSATVPVPSAATKTATPALNALTPAGIGTVTLGGTAEKYSQVSALIDAVNKIDGLSSCLLSSAAKSGEVVTFTMTAVVTSAALSGRFTKKAG